MSDEAIALTLKSQGITVARRTVAKYRNALKILPARLRRRSASFTPREQTDGHSNGVMKTTGEEKSAVTKKPEADQA